MLSYTFFYCPFSHPLLYLTNFHSLVSRPSSPLLLLCPCAQMRDAMRMLCLEAAKAIFSELGVDAPVRKIAQRAGVGVGTVYRRFPNRSDLVAAVFRREVDSCAKDAVTLALAHKPGEALVLWLKRYTEFIRQSAVWRQRFIPGIPPTKRCRIIFEQILNPLLHPCLRLRPPPGRCAATSSHMICSERLVISPWCLTKMAPSMHIVWSIC